MEQGKGADFEGRPPTLAPGDSLKHLGQMGALYHMGKTKTADQLAVVQAEIRELRTRHSQAVEELRGCLKSGGCPVFCGPGPGSALRGIIEAAGETATNTPWPAGICPGPAEDGGE